jgi:hypothetical protein
MNELEKEEITLKELIQKFLIYGRYLFSNWVIIFAVGIIGGIIGFFYAYKSQTTYSASTTFVLEENGNNNVGQYAGLASMVGLDLGSGGGGLFQGDNIMELYKSRMMLQSTLLSTVKYNGTEHLLVDAYIELNKLRQTWEHDSHLKNVTFNLEPGQHLSRLQDSLLGVFVNDIDKNYLFVSKPDKKLSIIEVKVKAQEEMFAKLFNDQVVKNVNDFYIQTKTKKSLSNLLILQHQTDSVRNVLNGAISVSAMVTDATPNLNPTRQVLRAPIQRSQFSVEANKAILVQLVQNLELSKMSLRKETPLIQVIDKPILPLDRVRLSKVKAIIVGGFIAGFLAVLCLLVQKIMRGILN